MDHESGRTGAALHPARPTDALPSSPAAPVIGINLLTCNRRPEHFLATKLAVESLLASDAMRGARPRLVAVDNGSTDGTVAFLREAGFVVLALERNVGIAAGRNLGYSILLDDPALEIVVEIHNDMVFPAVWLGPLIDAMAEDWRIGLACASLLTQRGVLGSPCVPLSYNWSYERIREVVGGAAVTARRPGLMRPGLQHPVAKRVAMLREIGLYDEGFAGGNFEDTDEVYRAQAAGYRYVVMGDSIVWHYYVFSRLTVGPSHQHTYRANLQRFLAKWPDAQEFLRVYNAQTEAIYR